MRTTCLFFLFTLTLLLAACGDDSGINGGNSRYTETDWFYKDDVVREIRITIDPAVFTNIVWDVYKYPANENVYGLASSISIDGETMTNIGIRTRGNTSEGNWKRQFKLSFDCTEPYTNAAPDAKLSFPEYDSRRFRGTKKLNLRASQNDPTIIREKVASYIFAKAGAPAPRVGFARVYINNEYWGLYLVVEQIDKTFLDAHLNEKGGNLYKSAYGPFSDTGEGSFELKTNNELNDRSGLEAWSLALQGTSTKTGLEALVNVDNILNYMAATVLVGHWDSFLGNLNNDYLYHHSDNRFRIIGWDFDNTFGSDWTFNTLAPSIYSWNGGSDANWDLLFSKMMNIPEWKTSYTQKVQALLTAYYNPAHLNAKIDAWKSLIQDAALADPRKQLDKGYSESTGDTVWTESFDQNPSAGSWAFSYFSGGLKGYIAERAATAQTEINSGSLPDSISLTISPTTPRIWGAYYGIDLRTDQLSVAVTASAASGIRGIAIQCSDGYTPWTTVGIDTTYPYALSVSPPFPDWQQLRAVMTNNLGQVTTSGISEWVRFYRTSAVYSTPSLNGGECTFFVNPADLTPAANSTNVYLTGTFTSPAWMGSLTNYADYMQYRLTNANIGGGILCITVPATTGGEYKFLVDVDNNGKKYNNTDWFRDPANPYVAGSGDNSLIP